MAPVRARICWRSSLHCWLFAACFLAAGCARAHWQHFDALSTAPAVDAGAAPGLAAGRDAGADAGSSAATDAGRPDAALPGKLSATIVAPSAPPSIDVGAAIDFKGRCTGPAAITQQSWDVPSLRASVNGDTLTQLQFNDEGLYTVTFHCADAAGASARASIVVSVWRLPSVAFTGLVGPSTPVTGGGLGELDAYAASLTQLDQPRLISPPRQAPSTILPTRDLPTYDATGQHVLVVAAYRHTYAEALLITPCRASVSCNQASVQPLLQAPLDARYARWSADFQSVIVAGQHDLYVVPVTAGVAGPAVQISDRFGDPVDLDGPSAEQPSPPFVFVAHGSALAFRTRAPESPRPTGLAIADVTGTLAGGTAIVHDVQGLLPWSTGDTANAVNELVAGPDGDFLVVSLMAWKWARGSLQHVASLDVTKWLADPSVVPVRLGPSMPDYKLSGLASGGTRFWLEADFQGSAGSSPTGWVSYRWDGSDPIWLSQRWPGVTRVATCGVYAITDLTDPQMPLQVLQVTSSGSFTLQSIAGARDVLYWDGFSKDCRYALFEKEGKMLVLVDLQARTFSYGPVFKGYPKSAIVDPSGRYLLSFDNWGPRTLFTLGSSQLQSVLDFNLTHVITAFTDHALYYAQNGGSPLAPKPTELFRLALDGSSTPVSIGLIGGGPFGMASAASGDHVSYVGGYHDVATGTLAGMFETNGASTEQLLTQPERASGTVDGLTPLGAHALLMRGAFVAGGSELYAANLAVTGPAHRQSPPGFWVDLFEVAPDRSWLTAWSPLDSTNSLVAALGVDPSVDTDSARGTTTSRGRTLAGIEDAFATLLVDQHTQLLQSDGTTRDPWGDQQSAVAAMSATHLVVRLGDGTAASPRHAVLVATADPAQQRALPEITNRGNGAWISPDDRWLLYAVGPDDNGPYHWRALDFATDTITDLQAPDGSALVADLYAPLFTSDGQAALVSPPATSTASGFACGPLYVITRGKQRATQAGGKQAPHVCARFVAPSGSRFAFDADGLYVADTMQPQSVRRVGPANITFAQWSPDARYLAFFEQPFDDPPGPASVVDMQHPERGPALLPYALPYSFNFDRSGQRLLAGYARGWDRGFAVWTLDAPAEPKRIAPTNWTLGSAIWVE